jgi:hypothetical protein
MTGKAHPKILNALEGQFTNEIAESIRNELVQGLFEFQIGDQLCVWIANAWPKSRPFVVSMITSPTISQLAPSILMEGVLSKVDRSGKLTQEEACEMANDIFEAIGKHASWEGHLDCLTAIRTKAAPVIRRLAGIAPEGDMDSENHQNRHIEDRIADMDFQQKLEDAELPCRFGRADRDGYNNLFKEILFERCRTDGVYKVLWKTYSGAPWTIILSVWPIVNFILQQNDWSVTVKSRELVELLNKHSRKIGDELNSHDFQKKLIFQMSDIIGPLKDLWKPIDY